MFYNTGIGTYFWIVTNRKDAAHAGKVTLLDARGDFTRLRKGLGDKRKEFSDNQIVELARLYHDAADGAARDDRVKVFRNGVFGYQRVVVEQPMRRVWGLTPETVVRVRSSKAYLEAIGSYTADGRDPVAAVVVLDAVIGSAGDWVEATADAFQKRLMQTATKEGAQFSSELLKVAVEAAARYDVDAPIMTDRRGQPLPDPDRREIEEVPLDEDVEEYLRREVLPATPDAWLDHAKTKVGYEIPFTMHFYRYVPPRSVDEIDAEIAIVEEAIADARKWAERRG